jgi:hypothetical protein
VKKISEYIYIIPILLIASFLPLVVHYRKIELDPVAASYWLRDFNTDFFSYYKMVFLIGFVIAALIAFLIYSRNNNKITKNIYYYPAFIYLVMVIVATIFSETKFTSLYGFPDRYEGVVVLVSYIIIFLITINLFNKKRQFNVFLVFLFISAILISTIGLTQFFSNDFLQSNLGLRLILPTENFAEIAEGLDFRFEGSSILFSTLYNPNYAGSYFSMLLMISAVLFILIDNIKVKVLVFIVNAFTFAGWLGSLSRAGMLGSILSTFILVIILQKRLIKKYRSIIILLLLFSSIFWVMDSYTDGALKREFLSFGEETELALKGEEAKVKDIITEDNELRFVTEDHNLSFSFNEESELQLREANDNFLNLYRAEDYLLIDDSGYEEYKFRVLENEQDNGIILNLIYGNKRAEFLYLADLKSFFMLGIRNNIYSIKEVESIGFQGKEELASKRGYIWSRTIPLIKERPILGYGPDSFAIYFPQEDAVGKFKYFNTAKKIVDKPHNFYLQQAVNTGLISLAAIILLFGLYFIRSLFLYYKTKNFSYYNILGIAFFSAFNAYAAAAFFNDSVISVAPVFWVILGLGIAAELKIKNDSYKGGEN